MNWKFSPLFNEDGSTCYFRVTCLALAATCALLHVFLKALSGHALAPESGDIHLAEQQQEASVDFSDEEDSSWSLFGMDSERKQLLQNRKLALTEINDGASYLEACGNINAGYVGCKYTFSEKLSPFYNASIEAADDGFMITLEAKGEQLKDYCSRFVINSEGYFGGFNRQGNMDQKCSLETTPSAGMKAVNRSVDHLPGNPAPSGAMLVAEHRH